MIKKHKSAVVVLLLLIGSIFFITAITKNEHMVKFISRFYFDQKYYLSNYPDLRQKSTDPYEHFITEGWKEGKNPSASFDTSFYILYNLPYADYTLDKYAHKNPLLHYVSSKLSRKKVYINKSQLKKAQLLKNPKYYLAATAIFRDEARFLKEWIEFYRLLGVEHFYLYNHLSTDNYKQVLEPYIKEGLVSLFEIADFKNLYQNLEPKEIVSWNTLQTNLYSLVCRNLSEQVEWLMVIDTDEFLFPVMEDNLVKILKNYDEYATLSVNWQIFGTNGIQKIKKNELLIERLLMSSNNLEDRHVKSIVKPRYVKNFINPHFPNLKKDYGQVTEDFQYFYGPLSPTVRKEKLRINHYTYRDLEFLHSVKIKRLTKTYIRASLTEEELKNNISAIIDVDKKLSAIYDDVILKFVPELRLLIK